MAFVQEEGMRLATVLSAIALIVALMQGVLGLESTAPSRISLRKAHLLLGLEVFELSMVCISEVITFKELQKALNVRMDWLNWLPHAVLALGIFELLIDGFFTFRTITFSRAFWVPLSALGGVSGWAETVEFVLLLITCSLSIVLVGWRQALWWRGNGYFALESEAITAEKSELLLHVVPFAIAIAFALILLMVPTFLALVALFRTLYGIRSDGEYTALWHLNRPRTWRRSQNTAITPRLRRQYELLVAIMRPDLGTLRNDDVTSALSIAPLHIGNTLVGEDCDAVADQTFVQSVRWQQWKVGVVKQVAILPFLILVIVALYRVHEAMDKALFEVFTELADVATVVVLQEFAMGVKSFIWKLRGLSSDRHHDDSIEHLAYKKDDGDLAS